MLTAAGLNTTHLISIGGWDQPHPNTSFTVTCTPPALATRGLRRRKGALRVRKASKWPLGRGKQRFTRTSRSLPRPVAQAQEWWDTWKQWNTRAIRPDMGFAGFDGDSHRRPTSHHPAAPAPYHVPPVPPAAPVLALLEA